MRGLALAALLATVVFTSVRWGSFVAGGSDSYCYAHQAERWASGRLQVPEPLALAAPWPDAALAFAPAGHVPSRTVPGAIVPICPPGLAMAMALPLLVGGHDAMFLVLPLFGAVLIAATYSTGARYGARVGLAAAALTAASPVFLYQLVQPMSDVPAAALWTVAAASATSPRRRGAIAAGLAAGAAIVMRPNLVLLGVPIGLFLLFRPERRWRDRVRSAAMYAAGAGAGCVLVGIIQNAFYGSPFSSGYGSLDVLFRLAHVAPNASRYFAWMTETHTPAWLVALAAPLLLPGSLSALLLSMVAVNVALYLPYVVFDVWWYLRFLLPAIPLVMVLLAAVVDAACRRVRPGWSVPVLTAVTVVLAVLFVRAASERHAFELQRIEARFARAGRFVADRLPANALVFTSWESGSVRFYSGRRTLVWDGLDPEWLDRAVEFARLHRLEPFLLFERWEEPQFRQRFAGSPLAALDWPPMAEIGGEVRIYRPDDRGRYQRGMNVTTEYAR
jgi:hypothetical protein